MTKKVNCKKDEMTWERGNSITNFMRNVTPIFVFFKQKYFFMVNGNGHTLTIPQINYGMISFTDRN